MMRCGSAPCQGTFRVRASGTSAQLLNPIQRTPRASGGDLQRNRQGVYAGREQTLQEMARQMPWEAKKPVRMGRTREGYFSPPRRVPDRTPPVRIVWLWRERDDPEARNALGRNRLGWEVRRRVVGYRYRWTGTETCPRDGKQQ